MSELHSSIEEVTDDVIIPDTDKKKYRALKLKNEMKVLIIHDPDADMSAAALNVSVGAMCDPVDLPGLAHFCEHMVFLGSEKYPAEDAYFKFMATHGGYANAYTSKQSTNFHFRIAPQQFKEALDMFAQFFLCPLFTESATQREINAVNHEDEGRIKNDILRWYQLAGSLCKPGHDYGKFSGGNRLSLETIPKEKGINIREELLKFHDKYYSSNLMGLAVLCKEPLDEMTKYVCELFGEVVNKNVEEPSWSDHPYGPEELRKRVSIVPVKDIRWLDLVWPCGYLRQWWESKPDQYVAHLVGHEGPGSLLSKLKANSWVDKLWTCGRTRAKGISFLSLHASLTEEGLEHVDDVITLIHQYINMVKQEGPQQHIIEECRDLAAIVFKFKDDEQPLPIVRGAASNLGMYPLEETLSGPHLWKQTDTKTADDLIGKLDPENMMSLVVSKTFAEKADQKEKWYGIEYSVEQHDLELETTWSSPAPNECFKLPEPNKFIPSNFDICERDTEATEYPRIIKNTAFCKCWFKQDNEFLLPKGQVNIAITSHLADVSPLHANLLILYVRLVNDLLVETCYDAELAQLTYKLWKTGYGLQLRVQGYTDKLHLLLEKVLSTLTTYRVDDKRFTILKEQLVRGWKNSHKNKSTSHADRWLDYLLNERIWTVDEHLAVEDELTEENLTDFMSQFWLTVHVEMLVYGNFTQSTAQEVSELVVTSLTTNRKCKPLPLSLQNRNRRAVELPDDTSYIYTGYNDVHPSSCVYVYLQIGQQCTHINTLTDLLVHIIKNACFTTLRTQEQLGYLVWSSAHWTTNARGLRIAVEGERHPKYVETRIETFLASVGELFEKLSPSEYQNYVTGLIAAKLIKPKNMEEQTDKYWDHISSGEYNFNRTEVETEYLKTITKSQLVHFYKEHIASDSKKRRKLSVHIKSKQHRDEFKPSDEEADKMSGKEKLKEGEVIDSHIDFRESCKLFPLPQAVINIPSIGSIKL